MTELAPMTIILLTVLFVLLTAAAYLLLQQGIYPLLAKWRESERQTLIDLDTLYISISPATFRRLQVGVIALLALAGFLLPGQLPRINRLLLDKAVTLNRAGRYEQALDSLERLRDVPSPLAFNERGLAYLALGNPNAAAESFKEAIALLPEYSVALHNLAQAYDRLDNPQEARFSDMRARQSMSHAYPLNAVYGLERPVTANLLPRLALAFLLGLPGALVPRVIVHLLRKRRVKKFDALLPDGLMMAANALRAGLSLEQALDIIAREGPEPLNQEFSLVLKEYRLGREFDDALANLAKRMPTDDTYILVSAVAVLRQAGANMSEKFESIADTIRERKRIQQKIKTMTAEGETQAVILSILPFFLAWFLHTMNPEVFSLFYTTGLGWMMMIGMVLWGGLGFFFMWKTVQVDI